VGLEEKRDRGEKKNETSCFHVCRVTQIKSVEESLPKHLSVDYLLPFLWQKKDGN